MNRHAIASLFALGLTLIAAPTFAQEQPRPGAVAPQPVAVAAQPAAGGAVRLHLRTYRGQGTARLYIHRSDGSYTFVCASPCTADVAAHSELRVTLRNNDEEPHTFEVPSDLGPEIDAEVRPASSGPLIGGIVLMGSGGAIVLSGALMVIMSDLNFSGSLRNSQDEYKTIGFVMMGLGVATAVGGLIWLLSRSHEPRVQGAPHLADVYGRRETVLGDVAAQKPRDPTTAVLPAAAPFTLSFTF